PLGGTYQDNVQVSITSTSANTTVRYTLDGSTPSASNGQIYAGAFTLTRGSTAVKAIAYDRGWLASPVASTSYTVLTPLPFWRNLHGLPADGSQDLATPAGDGVTNLLKYAFNLASHAGDLAKPNASTLAPNGTAGLPRVAYDGQRRLVIEFVRRKVSSNAGIAYIVETGPDLMSWSALSLTNASVVSIDATWERVTITDPTVAERRFGRVRVLGLDVYFNDFNAALGPAALRGNAQWLNQSVQLTDTQGGQAGAVTFSGIALGSHVSGFTARFKLALGPTTTGLPADGANFAVGDLGSGAWGETGPATAHHLAVGFDTYDNGSANANIGIHLWVNGAHVAANAINPYTNGALVPVEISYDPASGVSVNFNGTTVFNGAAISGFGLQTGDQFGISARTAGANERAVVDDVEITPR
ncbi:MAG TPA: chitobiase/beta-hexosaminidase C-terminal domain-containing protein, partial [Thermoanaerobaculia bacterium]